MTNLQLQERINQAFMDAVQDAVRKFKKKNGKISELQLKHIVEEALISYKNGIVEALRFQSILDEVDKKKE